jgi:hypothetical protein
LALLLAVAGCGSADSTTSTDAASSGRNGEDPLKASRVTSTFENGDSGWSSFNGGKLATVSEPSVRGSSSLRVTTKGAAGFEGAQTVAMPVTGSTMYRATAQVQVPKGAEFQFALRELDKDGEELGANVPTFTGIGEWDEATVTLALNAETEDVVLQLRTADRKQDVVFYVDEVALRPVG